VKADVLVRLAYALDLHMAYAPRCANSPAETFEGHLEA